MRKFLTKEQLLDIWEMGDDFDARKRYAKEIDSAPVTVGQAMGYLRKFVSGEKKFGKYTPKAYIKAVKTIWKADKQQIADPIQEATVQGGGNLERLEKALATFQEAIAEVIISEVEVRSSEKVAQKEKELAQQKEKYEQELLKLQAIVTEAKNSSITGLIKKKWMTL